MTKIIVDCEQNDPVDIRCGGPSVLGFDFFVKDEIAEDAIKEIKRFLKKYKRPLMSITSVKMSDADADRCKGWSIGEIEVCIKEGY